MLFNSLEFLLFIPITFVVYWLLQDRLKIQNLFIVIASYVFYGWWDWRFLMLIGVTSLLSYYCGIAIFSSHNTGKPQKAKFFSIGNVIVNLFILGVFKYFNFFVDSFVDFLSLWGIKADMPTLKIILPVGISFYTFQALSYSIDVYRHKLEPTKDIVAFFAYVSFFPQLVAGPIERATNLLPQILRKRKFDYRKAVEGSKLIIWGFFKKLAIADTASEVVDTIFNGVTEYNSSTLLLGAVLFSFQIYGDFSGYSDIAIGTAKLFGIELKKNFNLPYLSRNVAEFWWFVDYVYIPIAGSRISKSVTIRNTFVVFLLSGLWHGANWTYVCWGAYHALLFVPLLLLGTTKKYGDYNLNRGICIHEVISIFVTFFFVVVGWVIFRASDMNQAVTYIERLFSHNYGIPDINPKRLFAIAECIAAVFVLCWIEVAHRGNDIVFNFKSRYRLLNWIGYLTIAIWGFLFYNKDQTFIYFQF